MGLLVRSEAGADRIVNDVLVGDTHEEWSDRRDHIVMADARVTKRVGVLPERVLEFTALF
jgi:hypothetical protein